MSLLGGSEGECPSARPAAPLEVAAPGYATTSHPRAGRCARSRLCTLVHRHEGRPSASASWRGSANQCMRRPFSDQRLREPRSTIAAALLARGRVHLEDKAITPIRRHVTSRSTPVIDMSTRARPRGLGLVDPILVAVVGGIVGEDSRLGASIAEAGAATIGFGTSGASARGDSARIGLLLHKVANDDCDRMEGQHLEPRSRNRPGAAQSPRSESRDSAVHVPRRQVGPTTTYCLPGRLRRNRNLDASGFLARLRLSCS